MKSLIKILIIYVFLFIFPLFNQIKAVDNCNTIQCSLGTQSEDQYLDCNHKKQQCWEDKINQTQQESMTLKGTISILNGQISLQQLQTDQTLTEVNKLKKEVTDLVLRMNGLSLSLDRLTNILIERIRSNYKKSRSPILYTFFKKKSFAEIITQLKYLSSAQQQTAQAMKRTESQRLVYNDQRELKEEKQLELEKKQILLKEQKEQLDHKKVEQQYLLTETQSNESQYQKELAKTLSELEAIQSIIAGKGSESKVKEVNEGDKIASIIPGASACSTGTHLHFEVVKDGTHRDPAGYLKSIAISWQNSPDGSFGFTGNWQWPVDNSALITQGYGMTYYARVKRIYGGAPHTGIDMVSKTSGKYNVRSVKTGTLYRGSIKCGGGLLKYVKVEHKDEGIQTYYLHVNY